MSIAIAVLLTLSEIASGGALTTHQCSADVESVERAAVSRRLTLSGWRSFRAVAKTRMSKGIEVLPGMIGCPGLTDAILELKSDPQTVASLRRRGISPKDYIEIGWALLVAYDPDAFPTARSPVVVSNIAFVAKHRAEIEALLSAR